MALDASQSQDQAPAEVRLGTVLVSLLEPDRGREVEFHRWYERDHFYAGCMAGANFFSGRRFVATRALKDERLPEQDSLFEDVADGSYLALYWMLAGFGKETIRWAVDRVQNLIAHDRMMTGRRPVHAGFYEWCFSAERDVDGVPAELALDHPFGGVGMTMLQAPSDAARADLLEALESRLLPETLAGSEVSLSIALTPTPLPDDAPSYVVRPTGEEARVLLLSFFADAPVPAMRDWTRRLVERVEGEGLGRLELAAPFIPTIPGSDRYSDELW
jgi:hypothetical protein